MRTKKRKKTESCDCIYGYGHVCDGEKNFNLMGQKTPRFSNPQRFSVFSGFNFNFYKACTVANIS